MVSARPPPRIVAQAEPVDIAALHPSSLFVLMTFSRRRPRNVSSDRPLTLQLPPADPGKARVTANARDGEIGGAGLVHEYSGMADGSHELIGSESSGIDLAGVHDSFRIERLLHRLHEFNSLTVFCHHVHYLVQPHAMFARAGAP
jgi:hypothetical protein